MEGQTIYSIYRTPGLYNFTPAKSYDYANRFHCVYSSVYHHRFFPTADRQSGFDCRHHPFGKKVSTHSRASLRFKDSIIERCILTSAYPELRRWRWSFRPLHRGSGECLFEGMLLLYSFMDSNEGDDQRKWRSSSSVRRDLIPQAMVRTIEGNIPFMHVAARSGGILGQRRGSLNT